MPTSGSSGPAAFRRALRGAAPSLKRPLPWIGHPDPWAVLVSEVMLQQTPAARVVAAWGAFLERFPTATACADAPLADVIVAWSGLGYHRRARALHRAARLIRDEFGGAVPRDEEALLRLPGVGRYTASAVRCFAFAAPVAVLDTNVGRVLARALENRTLGSREAAALALALAPARDTAAFNQAMLDLGAQFCRAAPRCASCPVARSCRWRREGGDDPAPRSAGVTRSQGRFEGSERQLRGRILAALRASAGASRTLSTGVGGVSDERLATAIDGLVRDGLVERRSGALRLAR